MPDIGAILREARKQKQVSCSQAAAATRMKMQHIEALERNDFSRIAAPIYAKGFIRLYAEYLDLDPEPLLREYTERLAPAERPSLRSEEPKPPRPPLARLLRCQVERLWAWGRPHLVAHWKPLAIAGLAAVLALACSWYLRRRGDAPVAEAGPSGPPPREANAVDSGRALPLLREPPDAYLEPSWNAEEGLSAPRPEP